MELGLKRKRVSLKERKYEVRRRRNMKEEEEMVMVVARSIQRFQIYDQNQACGICS